MSLLVAEKKPKRDIELHLFMYDRPNYQQFICKNQMARQKSHRHAIMWSMLGHNERYYVDQMEIH